MSNPSYSIRFPSNSDSQMALSSKQKRRREENNSCAPYKWEFLLFYFFVIRDLYFVCFVFRCIACCLHYYSASVELPYTIIRHGKVL